MKLLRWLHGLLCRRVITIRSRTEKTIYIESDGTFWCKSDGVKRRLTPEEQKDIDEFLAEIQRLRKAVFDAFKREG